MPTHTTSFGVNTVWRIYEHYTPSVKKDLAMGHGKKILVPRNGLWRYTYDVTVITIPVYSGNGFKSNDSFSCLYNYISVCIYRRLPKVNSSSFVDFDTMEDDPLDPID